LRDLSHRHRVIVSVAGDEEECWGWFLLPLLLPTRGVGEWSVIECCDGGCLWVIPLGTLLKQWSCGCHSLALHLRWGVSCRLLMWLELAEQDSMVQMMKISVAALLFCLAVFATVAQAKVISYGLHLGDGCSGNPFQKVSVPDNSCFQVQIGPEVVNLIAYTNGSVVYTEYYLDEGCKKLNETLNAVSGRCVTPDGYLQWSFIATAASSDFTCCRYTASEVEKTLCTTDNCPSVPNYESSGFWGVASCGECVVCNH